MKKIFFEMAALVCSMSMSAQTIKVYKGTEVVATYTAEQADSVVFEEAPAVPSHAYVEIGGLKWATMNLGATTVAGRPSTCYGDYYAWGETEPRYTSITISSDGTSASFGGWSSSHSSGYSESDYPTYTGSTLDADHDAATKNWGSGWRTATKDDYVKLYEACGGTGGYISSTLPIGTTSTTAKGIYWCNDYDGVKGLLFSDGTNKVFFPAAGVCEYTSFVIGGSGGRYWSSSLMTNYTSSAYYLYFDSSDVDPSYDGDYRYRGITVRPVSGDIIFVTSITLDNTSLSIESGRKMTLTPTVLPANATAQTVTWTSSNTKIAMVSTDGVVTAVAEGTATITATANDGSGVSATCAVTVTPKHDYVEIGGLKWATMNVGATTVAGSPSTCYGDYYAWGETEPRYISITINGENSVSFGGWSSSHSSGYSSSDYPSYTGTTLDAAHDAATKNWGFGWRTPTSADFQALAKACTGSSNGQTPSALSTSSPTGGIYWLSSSQTYISEYKGVAGILFVDKTDTSKRVFFPATGNCGLTSFGGGGSDGLYWSSSLVTSLTNIAYILRFDSSGVGPSGSGYRYCGFSVRPVSE